MPSEDDRVYRSSLEKPELPDPRRRLLERGAKTLSNTELLSVILGGKPATARRLVRRYGLDKLHELATGWQQEQGLGASSAARLLAVCELARRTYAAEAAGDRPRLTRPLEVFRHVRPLTALKKEHLVGLYLDVQNGLLHQETISVGSLNTTRTHPREILHPAIVHLAAGFLLAHNHPSGSLEPSHEDVEFTAAVRRAGEIMGIELYDHLIVAGSGFTSLRERGLL